MYVSVCLCINQIAVCMKLLVYPYSLHSVALSAAVGDPLSAK